MRIDLAEAARRISAGQPVAFPTETVYGLGAPAFDARAVLEIFKIKGRPADNPLIVHIAEATQLETLVTAIPEAAHKLAKAYWPGPLAIVLPKNPVVPDAVTAGLSKVAVRCPDHPLALALIRLTGPLAAPSANTSGRPSPTRAAHVEADFGAEFPVVDGGTCSIGIESTVVDLSGHEPLLLRPGAISQDMLKHATGLTFRPVIVEKHAEAASPGMKYTHYAPKATVRWWDGQPDSKALILTVTSNRAGSANRIDYCHDFSTFAKELYDRFRQADHEGFQSVAIERFSPDAAPIAAGLLNRIEKAIQR
jgi:L-threonylcarbamoyladenylate synthase